MRTIEVLVNIWTGGLHPTISVTRSDCPAAWRRERSQGLNFTRLFLSPFVCLTECSTMTGCNSAPSSLIFKHSSDLPALGDSRPFTPPSTSTFWRSYKQPCQEREQQVADGQAGHRGDTTRCEKWNLKQTHQTDGGHRGGLDNCLYDVMGSPPSRRRRGQTVQRPVFILRCLVL